MILSTAHSHNVFAGEAALSWDPDAESDLAGYKIYYGTASGNYGPPVDVGLTDTPAAPAYSVTPLTDGTAYFFAVTAYDSSGNESVFSNEVSKTIAGTTPLILSGVTASNITGIGAVISWSTNEVATSQVEYGTTTDYGSSSALNSTLVTSHSVTLSGLSVSTAYHFRILSLDASGNLAASGDNILTTGTTSDSTPPVSARNFSATAGNQQISLSWTNPSDPDFMAVRILYRTDRYPSDINDGTSLGDFAGQPDQRMNITHQPLQNGVMYYYAASAFDVSGNFQTMVYASATPDNQITVDNQNTVDNPRSTSSGGCGMVRPTDGKSSGPGQAADMTALLAVILIAILKREIQRKLRLDTGDQPTYTVSGL